MRKEATSRSTIGPGTGAMLASDWSLVGAGSQPPPPAPLGWEKEADLNSPRHLTRKGPCPRRPRYMSWVMLWEKMLPLPTHFERVTVSQVGFLEVESREELGNQRGSCFPGNRNTWCSAHLLFISSFPTWVPCPQDPEASVGGPCHKPAPLSVVNGPTEGRMSVFTCARRRRAPTAG